LNALGIVAKEQQLVDGFIIIGKLDFF